MNKEVKEEKLIRLKRLSERLDNTFTIPGTKYKIGIEALIGAVPIIGDLIGGILASYIMYSGMKMGAPPRIIARMAVNIAIDFAIGSIPIIGDLFDLVWKANRKNVELIEDATLDDKEEQKLNYLIITALILVLLGILLLILTMFS
jgi:hypothetical protein|tara:strand:- start:148 stop:585 length:438 start_codon:yes stop_codon:yes gene_type:complete